MCIIHICMYIHPASCLSLSRSFGVALLGTSRVLLLGCAGFRAGATKPHKNAQGLSVIGRSFGKRPRN